MKKILSIVLLCIACMTANAQGVIRSIIFADNNDSRIGKGVQCNLDGILEEIDIISSCTGIDAAAPIVYEQFKCSPGNLRQCIKNFKCGTNDIVLFFYFGHGMRSKSDKSEFPQMCLGTDFSRQNEWIPLEDVKNVIQKQNPRFLLVFGDLCNSSDYGVSPKYGVLTSAGPSEINSKMNEAMKRLFVNCRGTVIACGSKAHEASWYDNRYTVGGGFFTMAFMAELEDYTMKNANADWNTLMSKVQSSVLNRTKKYRQEDSDFTLQTPHFRVNVTYNGSTTQQNTTMKDKQITEDNNRNNPQINIDKKDLHDALVEIANENNSPSARLSLRQSVLSRFANGSVIVDLMGRNGTFTVSSEKASDFIDRISTAFYLKNISILECQKDSNGKVTYLKVHEIYERNK